MFDKVLLLNATYHVIGFITDRRALKLWASDKIDVLSEWEHEIHWTNGKIKMPATIKLKYAVPIIKNLEPKPTRRGIFKRDFYLCQYCGYALTEKQATVDHIIPTSRGGNHTWLNCITCCNSCNSRKGNKTADELGWKLLNQPSKPESRIKEDLYHIKNKHPDWKMYIGN